MLFMYILSVHAGLQTARLAVLPFYSPGPTAQSTQFGRKNLFRVTAFYWLPCRLAAFCVTIYSLHYVTGVRDFMPRCCFIGARNHGGGGGGVQFQTVFTVFFLLLFSLSPSLSSSVFSQFFFLSSSFVVVVFTLFLSVSPAFNRREMFSF